MTKQDLIKLLRDAKTLPELGVFASKGEGKWDENAPSFGEDVEHIIARLDKAITNLEETRPTHKQSSFWE